MRRMIYGIGIYFIASLVASCATMQSRYVILEQSYPPLPEGYEVEVFRTGSPKRPFVRVSRLYVHLERTHFIGSSFEDSLPELKKQARLSGAHAIIEIQERSWWIGGETRVYHVTATGIRYTEPRP